MTTKNQNYIELPVQEEVGTPEEGFVALGFARGKFQGRDAAGNPIFFYPPTYADVAKVDFAVEDWTGAGADWSCNFGPFLGPAFSGSRNLTVQVWDVDGNQVLGGVAVGAYNSITLSAAVPYSGTASITGVINVFN
jgi:hypothetical protein